jgi:hypothetical protein
VRDELDEPVAIAVAILKRVEHLAGEGAMTFVAFISGAPSLPPPHAPIGYACATPRACADNPPSGQPSPKQDPGSGA